jgi:hypothetical protein
MVKARPFIYLLVTCFVAALVLPLSDCSLQIHKNELLVYNSQVLTVLPWSLNATSTYWQTSTDPEVSPVLKQKEPSNIRFTASQITNGYFKRTGSHSPINSFTQDDINKGQIQFKHDGTLQAPAYMISVTDGVETISERADIVLFKYQEYPSFHIPACHTPQLLLLTNGSYLGLFNCSSGIYISFWNAQKMVQLGPSLQVTDFPVQNATAIQLANNNILVAYNQGYVLRAQILDPSGTSISTLYLTDECIWGYKLVAFRNGNFMLVRASVENGYRSSYSNYFEVKTILFEIDGTRLAAAQPVRKSSSASSGSYYTYTPTGLLVDALADDNFVLLYRYYRTERTQTYVRGTQVYAAIELLDQDSTSRGIFQTTAGTVFTDLLVLPGKQHFVVVFDLLNSITYSYYTYNNFEIPTNIVVSEHNTYEHDRPKVTLLGNGNLLFTWDMRVTTIGQNRRVATVRDLSHSQNIISEYILSNDIRAENIAISAHHGGDFMFWSQPFRNMTNVIVPHVDDRIGIQVNNIVIHSVRTIITEEHIVISSTDDVTLTIINPVHCHFELSGTVVTSFQKSDINARAVTLVYDTRQSQQPSFSVSATNGIIRTGLIPIQITYVPVTASSPIPIPVRSSPSIPVVASSSLSAPIQSSPHLVASSSGAPVAVSSSHVLPVRSSSTRHHTSSHMVTDESTITESSKSTPYHPSKPDEKEDRPAETNSILLYAMIYVGGAVTILIVVLIILVVVLLLRRNKDRTESFQRLEMQVIPSTNNTDQ